MDMDLQAGMGQDDSMFGIDNVGLDFNDFEILNGKSCKISDDYFHDYSPLSRYPARDSVRLQLWAVFVLPHLHDELALRPLGGPPVPW